MKQAQLKLIKMNLPWIIITPNLLEGASLMNSLSKDCFSQILNCIIQQSKNETVSLEDHIEKLKPTLNLKQEELVLVIQTLKYILKQASKVILKPTSLQTQLIDFIKVDEEKAEEIVKVWTEETINSFNLGSRKKLENVSWDLNLATASNVCYKETNPHARLQLGLSCVNYSEKENLILDLDEEELLSLYKTIENIQVKLDSIQNNSRQS